LAEVEEKRRISERWMSGKWKSNTLREAGKLGIT
jgi:hypothetical protein